MAEVIGAHLYDAYKAAGEDPDADDLRARACRAYVLAAERADAVGAPEAAETAYLKASELSSDEAEQAALTERAGRMASFAGWDERAAQLFEAVCSAHVDAGRFVDAARVTAPLGRSIGRLGRGEQAITRLREALSWLDTKDAPPDVVAELQSELGSALAFAGPAHSEEAAAALEQALIVSQQYKLSETLARALNEKGTLLAFAGRTEEALMHFEAAASIARRTATTRSEMNAEANLADLGMTQDLPGAEAHCAAALALARRRGARDAEMFTAGNLMYVLTISGRLGEAFRLGTELLQVAGEQLRAARHIHGRLAVLEGLVGHVASAEDHLAACLFWQESDDVQDRLGYSTMEAAVALARNDYQAALDAASRTVDQALGGGVEVAHESVRLAFPDAIDAALAIPYLTAQVTRCRALIASARGVDEGVEEGLEASETTFRELGYPYWVARAQLERAEWAARQQRLEDAAQLASRAAATFEMVGTTPMLVRARALLETDAAKGRGSDSELALVQSRPSPSE